MIKNNIDGDIGLNDFPDSVQIYYDELSKFNPLTKDEEHRLMKECHTGNMRAKDKILKANLKFVFDIAKKYRGRGVDMADLISEGNLGMIKAIDKFDTSKDVRFITYAVWWIRQSMAKAVIQESKKGEKQVSIDELEEREWDDSVYNDLMFDRENDNEMTNPMHDLSNSGIDVILDNERAMLKDKYIADSLSKLKEKERIVLVNYYGLEGEKQNFREIGNEMRISSERARQIRKEAIKHIQETTATKATRQILLEND